jgi:hypothetical protein
MLVEMLEASAARVRRGYIGSNRLETAYTDCTKSHSQSNRLVNRQIARRLAGVDHPFVFASTGYRLRVWRDRALARHDPTAP